MAAVGISVAELSDRTADWVKIIAIVVASVVALIAVALIYYLIRAFRLRLGAEVSANDFLDRLIERDPKRFWPPPPPQE